MEEEGGEFQQVDGTKIINRWMKERSEEVDVIGGRWKKKILT